VIRLIWRHYCLARAQVSGVCLDNPMCLACAAAHGLYVHLGIVPVH
jgi:hypothetical protein